MEVGLAAGKGNHVPGDVPPVSKSSRLKPLLHWRGGRAATTYNRPERFRDFKLMPPKPVRKLSHLDAKGRPAMVDVSAKAVTAREAVAESRVKFPAAVAAPLRRSAERRVGKE